MWRLLWVFLGLAVLVIVPFLIWGGSFEQAFSPAATADWLRDFGSWAWAAAIGLLIADLVLPVPATTVMTGLGLVYGTAVGGLVGTAGSMLAGITGYALCRGVGERVAVRLLGPSGFAEGQKLAGGVGVWLVVLSRWLPVFPEVIACMAGLTRMPAGRFLVALACGTVPLSFAFAALGGAGLADPIVALVLSAACAPVLWLIVRPVFNRALQSSKAEDR